MMRVWVLLLMVVASSEPVMGMTRIEDSGSVGHSASGPVQPLVGKLDAIHSNAGKMVIAGTTYAYSPLTTTVTINGKRRTIGDLRQGSTIQFKAIAQGSRQPPFLASIVVIE